MTDARYGWHFLPDDVCLAAYEERGLRIPGIVRVERGQTLRLEDRPRLCKRGFHGCRRALDALQFAPGPVVEYVRYSGLFDEKGGKFCATERTCLYGPADASPVLWEFTLDWRERAFWGRLLAFGPQPDPRSVGAFEVARRYLRGEATKKELDAAADAAGDVARLPAAWDAYSVTAHLADATRDAAEAARATAARATAACAAAAYADATRDAAAAARAAVLAMDAAWNAANADLEARLRTLSGMPETPEFTEVPADA